MILSMTGFGKAEVALEAANYTIDIRSLNSKNLDVNVRIPAELKSKELEIRKLINAQLSRGKVDVFVNMVALEGKEASSKINQILLKQYMKQFGEASPNSSEDTLLQIASRMPDILTNDNTELAESEWGKLLVGFNEALKNITRFRKDEGAVLETELKERIQNILQLLEKEIPKYESVRIETIKERMQKALENIEQADTNRFEQELIYYFEKLDITEEKVRLKNHCDYFLSEIDGEVSNGKKLNFICQEIGREINTLGSKSNHAEMQQTVVQMKDELEKIKEQILNIL